MVSQIENLKDIQTNGFVDRSGVRIYPFQPEKHDLLVVSKILPYFVDIYGLGVCPTGEVIITIDQNGNKIGKRLPHSERLTFWAKQMVDLIATYGDNVSFPNRLKIEYNTFLNDYIAFLDFEN